MIIFILITSVFEKGNLEPKAKRVEVVPSVEVAGLMLYEKGFERQYRYTGQLFRIDLIKKDIQELEIPELKFLYEKKK